MKFLGYTMLVILTLASLSFLLNGLGLFNLKFWGVKYQDARTEIFESTKAYKHGNIREIERMCLDLNKVKSPAHKNALRATIRHRLSSFDYNNLPQHVLSCVQN